MRPDQQCIDAAFGNGHHQVIDFFYAELRVRRKPSWTAVDKAAGTMDLGALQAKCRQYKLFPGGYGANEAAFKGRVGVLEWLAGLPRSILPSKNIVDYAAQNGAADVRSAMSLPIRTNSNDSGAKWAAEKGHLAVLLWMTQLDPPVYPDQNGANMAALEGHIDVLQWMAQLVPSVHPNQYGANSAARNGHLAVLEWMALRNVLPNQDGANEALWNDHPDVLEWMGRRVPPLRPDP
jgi:hypothetical protein